MTGRRRERGITRDGEPARMPAAGRVCGQEQGPAACDAPVFARGMCRRHYRRAAKGLPVDDGMPAIGSPSGHGRYGYLDEDPADGRITCHECGGAYVALGVHIGMAHTITVREYRRRHGLLMSQGLASSALSARLAEAATDAGTVSRLEPVRSPETLRGTPEDVIVRGVRIARATGRR